MERIAEVDNEVETNSASIMANSAAISTHQGMITVNMSSIAFNADLINAIDGVDGNPAIDLTEIKTELG